MKRTLLLIAIAATIIVACTKNTTNTTNYIIEPQPAFTVSGVHDVSLTNGGYGIELPITVQYSDSAQQVVSLSMSALPAGITMDTTWVISGIPTYSTTVTLLDTTELGATPGTYPMTLTATGAISGKRTFPFNIHVIAEPACVANLTGKYANCYSGCSPTGSYSDSVYADPTIPNRLWFTNVSDKGSKIYGKYNCNSQQISVPAQSIGGVIYSGSGNGFFTPTSRHISLNLMSTSSGSCTVTMNQ